MQPCYSCNVTVRSRILIGLKKRIKKGRCDLEKNGEPALLRSNEPCTAYSPGRFPEGAIKAESEPSTYSGRREPSEVARTLNESNGRTKGSKKHW
jgi:hypothetical protein